MASASVILPVELLGYTGDGNPRRFTVANANQVSKGIIMYLIDPRTASSAYFSTMPTNSIGLGITSMEKKAGDGSTALSLWTQGIFDLKCSGAVTLGDKVRIAGSNEVITLASTSGAHLVASLTFGTALETGSDGEIINVRVDL